MAGIARSASDAGIAARAAGITSGLITQCSTGIASSLIALRLGASILIALRLACLASSLVALRLDASILIAPRLACLARRGARSLIAMRLTCRARDTGSACGVASAAACDAGIAGAGVALCPAGVTSAPRHIPKRCPREKGRRCASPKLNIQIEFIRRFVRRMRL